MLGLTIVTTIGVFVLTCYLIYQYASKNTPKYIYLLCFLGYFLAFSIVVIVPYDVDLAISLQHDSDVSDLHDTQFILAICWRIVYWTVFLLCWVILPVSQEYEMAGEFTHTEKLKCAIKRHLKTELLTGALGAGILIYLFYNGQLSVSILPIFLIVLSNCWGLFLIIVLLGYGLVVIPRTFWQNGDLERTLKVMQFRAVVIDEGIVDTKYQLNEIVKLVNAASYHISGTPELRPQLYMIISKCPLEYIEHHKAMQTHNSRDSIEQLGLITEEKLIDLHKNLKKTLAEYRRSSSTWEVLMDSCIMLEDIITSIHSSDKKLTGITWTPKVGPFIRLREITEWLWYTRVKPLVCRSLAVCFGIMSVLVVLGEITLFTDIPIGLIPLLYTEDHGPVMNQIFVSIPLVYIILCTYYALFSLKLTGWYGLYPHNQTDPSNLVWSAFFLCRLTAPLCYNFLLLIKVTHTEYARIMGIIDIVPVLGNQFAVFFPLLLIIFCGLNYFHVYGKLLTALGMNQFDFDDKYHEEKVSEGKAMIARERIEREGKMGYRLECQTEGRSVKMNWEMAKLNGNDKEVEKKYANVKSTYLSTSFNI